MSAVSSRPHGPNFGIIGGGRLARHLAHYLTLRGAHWTQWTRSGGGDRFDALKGSRTLLLAVSDSAIEALAGELRADPRWSDARLVHFSGSVSTPLAWGFHPLMTFAEDLYGLELYERIPFIREEGSPAFDEVFPGFRNPSAEIPREKKTLYHAWCVMGGNFASFLWGRMLESFPRELGLAPELALPFLRQVAENVLAHPRDPRSTWTGPLARGDRAIVGSHLSALAQARDPYESVYSSFVESFEKEHL